MNIWLKVAIAAAVTVAAVLYAQHRDRIAHPFAINGIPRSIRWMVTIEVIALAWLAALQPGAP